MDNLDSSVYALLTARSREEMRSACDAVTRLLRSLPLVDCAILYRNAMIATSVRLTAASATERHHDLVHEMDGVWTREFTERTLMVSEEERQSANLIAHDRTADALREQYLCIVRRPR